MIPVYVPETAVTGFTTKPHYPKELVYTNNSDRSMEEIRAERYLERYVYAELIEVKCRCAVDNTKLHSYFVRHFLDLAQKKSIRQKS